MVGVGGCRVMWVKVGEKDYSRGEEILGKVV